MSGVDLVDFLLDRIAEDRATAQAVQDDPWATAGIYGHFRAISEPDGECWVATAPSRILWDCESKRALVERLAGRLVKNRVRRYGNAGNLAQHITAERDLRLLALPYADHPSFQTSWLPPS